MPGLAGQILNYRGVKIVTGRAVCALRLFRNRRHAPKFPEKGAYLAKIQGWGEGFWPKFQQASGSGQPAMLPVQADQNLLCFVTLTSDQS